MEVNITYAEWLRLRLSAEILLERHVDQQAPEYQRVFSRLLELSPTAQVLGLSISTMRSLRDDRHSLLWFLTKACEYDIQRDPDSRATSGVQPLTVDDKYEDPRLADEIIENALRHASSDGMFAGSGRSSGSRLITARALLSGLCHPTTTIRYTAATQFVRLYICDLEIDDAALAHLGRAAVKQRRASRLLTIVQRLYTGFTWILFLPIFVSMWKGHKLVEQYDSTGDLLILGRAFAEGGIIIVSLILFVFLEFSRGLKRTIARSVVRWCYRVNERLASIDQDIHGLCDIALAEMVGSSVAVLRALAVRDDRWLGWGTRVCSVATPLVCTEALLLVRSELTGWNTKTVLMKWLCRISIAETGMGRRSEDQLNDLLEERRALDIPQELDLPAQHHDSKRVFR